MFAPVAFVACLISVVSAGCVTTHQRITCTEVVELDNIPRGTTMETAVFQWIETPTCFTASQLKMHMKKLRHIEVMSSPQFCDCLVKDPVPCEVFLVGCAQDAIKKECFTKSTTGLIVGATVGGGLLVVVIPTGIFLRRRRQRRQLQGDYEMGELHHREADDDDDDDDIEFGPRLVPVD